ncbi:MAG: ATP-binding protein [Nanobdellota archaeon]
MSIKQEIMSVVKQTFQEHTSITNNSKLLVAVSGGKDSLVLLDVLLALGYDVQGLFVDEGISPYRDISLQDARGYCTQKKISLHEISFKEEFGFTMDDAVKTGLYHPCTICGTLRRYLLNKYSRQYTALLTGHHLDDEAQTVLINLFRAHTTLFSRSGPSTKSNKWFTQKIKPLYFVPEQDIIAYAKEYNITVNTTKCPNSGISYRSNLRKELDSYSLSTPEFKKQLLNNYMVLRNNITAPSQPFDTCQRCGQASNGTLCMACTLVERINNHLTQTSSCKASKE